MYNTVNSSESIKNINAKSIANIIITEGPISTKEISEISKLSVVTVNKLVEGLIEENMVIISDIVKTTGGRRAQCYEVNVDFKYYMGLYFVKEQCILIVSNYIGDIIYKEYRKIVIDSNLLQNTIDNISEVIKRYDDYDFGCIGIAVPGVVTNGIVSNIPLIPSWEGINIKKVLEYKFDIPVVVENDINAASLGMCRTNPKYKTNDFVLLYIDKGVGAGVVKNGDIYRGHNSFSGEIGILPYFSNNEANQNYTFESYIKTIRKNRPKNEDYWDKELVNVISYFIAVIACLINPKSVVLVHDTIQSEDIKYIIGNVKNIVGEVNVPDIYVSTDLEENGLSGLIELCLDVDKL